MPGWFVALILPKDFYRGASLKLGPKIGATECPFECGGGGRVRKSKNFPDSKIFTAKTFRIKRVNRNIDDFATNARKT